MGHMVGPIVQELLYNMATTNLVAASSQPKSGVGSLAETNRLLAQGATKVNAATSSGRDENPAGVAYQTFNPDGSVRNSYTQAQYSSKNSSDVASGLDTPMGVGGEIKAPTTPTNTPVSTAQPNPATANATPYTQGGVSNEQAQQNLLNGGLTGKNLTAAQSSLSASQQGHAAAQASGAAAPQEAGIGMSAAQTAMANANTGYAPPPDIVQAVTDAHQKTMDDYTKAMTSQDQGKSLVDQYKDFTNQLGIPALNTQLMNMKNVIDGTEDDIRNEVTKAGGFATDSQVLAMTNARNKTMIQNYNNLLQTRSDALQQVATLSNLSAQDRTYASQQIDRQLNFDQAQETFATKALENAQSSIQKSIDNYGAASVLKQALATGDPTAVARINATMGNGFDLHTAAAHPTLDEQVKQAQLSNIYSEISSRNNPAPKPQTQAQVVAQGYAQRAMAANATISKLGSQFTDITAIGGHLPSFLQSGNRQAYEQAKREFVNSVLRPESGASISPSEFASAEKEYFPQQGDSASAVYNKAIDRQLKINSLQQQGTNNAVDEAGQVVTYNGQQYTIDTNGDMTAI